MVAIEEDINNLGHLLEELSLENWVETPYGGPNLIQFKICEASIALALYQREHSEDVGQLLILKRNELNDLLANLPARAA